MIYQVCLGNESSSELYKHCINSVRSYCLKYDIVHIIQTEPILRIKPDPFMSNRSEESYQKHGGFLPIYEKENAFGYMDDYDQIAIVDADIFIRDSAPNIFEDFGTDHAFGAVSEREMPLTQTYQAKIFNYSRMQYNGLTGLDFKLDRRGFEFFNMGMILLNCVSFKPYLKGDTPKEFIERTEFMDFVNGKGTWKWSTDQTLLNFFLKKYKVPVKHMNHVWNGLYTANTKIKNCHFVHFFLKDKLPKRGEDIKQLMKDI